MKDSLKQPNSHTVAGGTPLQPPTPPPAPPPSSSGGIEFGEIKNQKHDDKEALLINDLQTEIQAVKKARCEERFIWVVVCVILVDVLWLRSSNNAGLALIVLILELIVFVVVARRMGVPEIADLVDRLMHSVGGRGSGA